MTIVQKRSLFVIGLIIAIFALWATMAYADLKFPEPKGYVSDFAGMLSQQTVVSLEDRLSSYDKKSGNEVAVVTVRDLQGTTVEDFAVRLFEKWKIGKKGKDNGVLLLVAKSERKVRIEVGYGLEPQLTDAQSFSIIRDKITPAFKAGDFDAGVNAGVDAIVQTLSGTYSPGESQEPVRATKPLIRGRDFVWLLYPAIFLFVGVIQWLVSVLGRTKSWWLGGVIGGVIGLVLMLLSVVVGMLAIALFVPLGLLFDFVVSRAYQDHKQHHKDDRRDEDRPIPWWAGGHWGPGGGFGGGRSGGGFGGFGGGGSGGGGASGDW